MILFSKKNHKWVDIPQPVSAASTALFVAVSSSAAAASAATAAVGSAPGHGVTRDTVATDGSYPTVVYWLCMLLVYHGSQIGVIRIIDSSRVLMLSYRAFCR